MFLQVSISNIYLGFLGNKTADGVEQMLFTNSIFYDYTALKSANVELHMGDSQFEQFRLNEKDKSSIEFKFDFPCHVHVGYVYVELSRNSPSLPDVSVSLYVNDKLFIRHFKVCRQNRFGIPPELFKRGENWFKLRLNNGFYSISRITITYWYIHPNAITYVVENDATISELKKYDFPEKERTAICNWINIRDNYAEFSKPGQSSIMMNFYVPDYKSISRIKLTLNHGRASDDEVVNIFVNNFSLQLMYSLTKKNSFEEVTFIIGKQFFKSGSNTVTINLTAESNGSYRLSQSVLEWVPIPQTSDPESEMRSSNTTFLRDLIQLTKTLYKVGNIFQRITSQFEELERLTDEVGKTRSASEMLVGLLCLSVDALRSISTETNTSVVYVMNNDESALIRVDIDATESKTDITRELNDTVEMKEAKMFYDQYESITRSVFSEIEHLLELPSESHILTVPSEGELDEISTKIESPSTWFLRELNIDADELLNLTDLISTITKSLKKPSAIAEMLSRYFELMWSPNYHINNLLDDYYEAMLSNLKDIFDEPSARGLYSVLCCAKTFHGYEKRDFSWINWLQHLNEDEFDDLENGFFRKLWSKLKNRKKDRFMNLYDRFIDIFVVSHGTIGAPEDGRYKFSAPVYHDVQQLLVSNGSMFREEQEIVFFYTMGCVHGTSGCCKYC